MNAVKEASASSKPMTKSDLGIDCGHGNVFAIPEKVPPLLEKAAVDLGLDVKDMNVVDRVCEDLVKSGRQDLLLAVLVYARFKLHLTMAQLIAWRRELRGPQAREFTEILKGVNRLSGHR